MKKNPFSFLLSSTLIGVIALSLIGVAQNEVYLILLFMIGFLPLFRYYLYLNKKDILTQTQIDSIYFFGFLVTLITLGSTAIRLVFVDFI